MKCFTVRERIEVSNVIVYCASHIMAATLCSVLHYDIKVRCGLM